MTRDRNESRPGRGAGTPVEEAPLWVLAILGAVLTLVCFPALVGIAEVCGFSTFGHRRDFALGAAALALLLVAGLALQKPWRRPERPGPFDARPPFVRFSTWLVATLLFPNVLYGIVVLSHDGPVDPHAAYAIGLIFSAIQGVYALADRWRRRGVSKPGMPGAD